MKPNKLIAISAVLASAIVALIAASTSSSRRADAGNLSPQGGTITAVIASSPLSGGGSGGPVTLGLAACASGQSYVWNGAAWACQSAGSGDITDVIAGTGLSGGASSGSATLNVSISGATCAASQAITTLNSSGSGTCTTVGDVTEVDVATGGGLTGGGLSGAITVGMLTSCAAGGILQWNGTAWACATISSSGGTVTNIATGAGLLGGPITTTGTITPDTTYLQRRVTGVCGVGKHITTVNADGTVVCDFDTDQGLSEFATGTKILTSDQNNYDACVSSTTGWCQITPSGGNWNLTGLLAPTTDGRSITIQNMDYATSKTITLKYSNASSSVNNRIITPGGVDWVIAAGGGVATLTYYTSGNRWYLTAFLPPVAPGTVSSITAGDGLTGGTITGSGTISLNQSCSAAQSLIWNGATWVCTWQYSSHGTGLSDNGGGIVSLNITPTTCTASKAETATAADGTATCTTFLQSIPATTCTAGQAELTTSTTGASTCTAVVDTMAGSASEGLACSTTAGAATCGLIQTCTNGQILAWSSAGSTWGCITPNAGTVTSATLTNNTMPVATGASGVKDSGTTDNGTTIKFGATSTTIDRATGNTAIAGTLGVTGAATLSSTLGVTGATTTNAITANGAIHAVSTLTVDGGATFNGLLTVQGGNKASFNGGQTTIGHITTTGTAPSGSGCSAALASTDTNGLVTMSGASTTSCALTFAQAYAVAPVCVCGNAGSAATEALTSCTATASVLTFNAVAATAAGAFSYICVGRSTIIP